MGLYETAPSRRFAYDQDGTQVFARYGSDPFQAETLANIQDYNDEDNDYVIPVMGQSSNKTMQILFMFPEARELDGYFTSAYISSSGFTTLETSVDTTNGVDGTWVTQVANMPDNGTTSPYFRDEIESTAISGIIAIRLSYVFGGLGTAMPKAIHFYGSITETDEDRLSILDTENSDIVFLRPIDWEETPRSTTRQRTLKIKNNSATLTASSVQITTEDLYLNAGDWYTYSLDGETGWTATLQIASSLDPGEDVTVYMKMAVPSDATLGLQTARVKVNVGSWA